MSKAMATPAPVVKPPRQYFNYSERDLNGLRSLAYKTPYLEMLLGEEHDSEDPFRRHCLDLAIPTAINFDRIMREYGGDPSGVEFKHVERDSWAFVLSDAAEPGRFRLQCFDQNGFYSHHSVDTLKKAVLDLVTERYLRAVPGDLDRLASTDAWRRGMAVTTLIQMLGSGQIDHAEFLRRQQALGPAQPA